MLLEVMRECKNFFVRTEEPGEFVVHDGEIEVNGDYLPGQFVLITGSILNDGVYRVEVVEDGRISFIAPPDGYPAWVAPVGTTGLYHYGDRVTHNAQRWVSVIDSNSWEPGAIGTANLWQQIHDAPEEHLTTNEEFHGTIYGLAVPPDFLNIVDQIIEFQKQPISNIVSESFGVYSETKATDVQGQVATWVNAFRSKLNKFRKMYSEVEI